MYIVDGIAYAPTGGDDQRITAVKALDDQIMILTFSSGERRLFDASSLLELPAFEPLRDERVFKTAKVDRGVVVWLDGDIDLAPETMYAESYPYNEAMI